MTTTITINSDTPSIIELLQQTPPPIVDVIQLSPPRVNIIGMPGEQGPQGPPGPGSTTKQVILVIPGGYGPTNSSANQLKVVSTGTPPADAPFVEYYQNEYAPNIDQEWFWKFTLPGNYDSGGTLRLTWGTKGTSSNDVVWKVATCFLIPSITDADASVFGTVVTAQETPNSTEGILTQTVIPLNMENAAINRPIIVMIGRNGNNDLDTNPNVAVLLEGMFEYVTT